MKLSLTAYFSCYQECVVYSIINLYVRVRPFSLAKDIIEKYKVNAKKTKAKGLRKEIRRKCDNAEEDRKD